MGLHAILPFVCFCGGNILQLKMVGVCCGWLGVGDGSFRCTLSRLFEKQI